MQTTELLDLVAEIVREAKQLKDVRTSEVDAPVNYACIFAQTEEEYQSLTQAIQSLGEVVQETAMGFVYKIPHLETAAGNLELVKIRRPDPNRPEKGDADFTLADYSTFKTASLGQEGFNLISRPDMEMIELVDPNFSVLAYFSHPTLADVLGI